MSMREYPITLDAVFIVDMEVAAYISLALDKKEGCVPNVIKALPRDEFTKMARAGTLPEDYGDVCVSESLSEVCFVSCFNGDIITLFPEKTPAPFDESTIDDGNSIYYIPSENAHVC